MLLSRAGSWEAAAGDSRAPTPRSWGSSAPAPPCPRGEGSGQSQGQQDPRVPAKGSGEGSAPHTGAVGVGVWAGDLQVGGTGWRSRSSNKELSPSLGTPWSHTEGPCVEPPAAQTHPGAAAAPTASSPRARTPVAICILTSVATFGFRSSCVREFQRDKVSAAGSFPPHPTGTWRTFDQDATCPPATEEGKEKRVLGWKGTAGVSGPRRDVWTHRPVQELQDPVAVSSPVVNNC